MTIDERDQERVSPPEPVNRLVVPDRGTPAVGLVDAAQIATRPAPRRRMSGGAIAANVALAILGIGFFLPLVWVVLAAFDAGATNTIQLPQLSLTNFQSLFQQDGIVTPFKNSVYLAGIATIVCTALALLAAYPLSRSKLPFKRAFLYTILFSTGLPVVMLLVPVYTMFVHFGLTDSLTFTAFFLASISLPFSIWLLKNFIDSVPVALEEAARVDGASSLQMLRYIIAPLTWPGISVAAVYTFISAWSAFLTPYILLLSPSKLPASVTIYQTEGTYGILHYGPLAAYSLLFSLPVVALYWLVARHFLGAFNFEGSVKA